MKSSVRINCLRSGFDQYLESRGTSAAFLMPPKVVRSGENAANSWLGSIGAIQSLINLIYFYIYS